MEVETLDVTINGSLVALLFSIEASWFALGFLRKRYRHRTLH